MLYSHHGLLNMKTNPTQPPIPDRGNPRVTTLELPCGKDFYHLRIQLSGAVEEKTITLLQKYFNSRV